LSLEYISTVPFQTKVSDVKIPEWGQHRSNRGMACPVSIVGICLRTQDQTKKNPGADFRCTADIFLTISEREIPRPGMLVARNVDQVGLVGCTNVWHTRRSRRKVILGIPTTITGVHLPVYSATFRVCNVHQFEIAVLLKWEICEKELDTFKIILVV